MNFAIVSLKQTGFYANNIPSKKWIEVDIYVVACNIYIIVTNAEVHKEHNSKFWMCYILHEWWYIS